MITFRCLSVGINKYPGNALQNCVNDANAIGAWTEAHGARMSTGYQRDTEGTAANMREGLRWLLSGPLEPGSVLLFSYSGHGAQVRDLDGDEPDGTDETLVPIDFNFQKPGTWFTDDALHQQILEAKLPPGVTLLVNVDACHAGTLLRGAPAPIRGLHPPLAVQVAARRGARSWVGLAPKVRQFGHRLASRHAAVALLAATKPTQLASDGSGSNGAHTAALLACLQKDAQQPLRSLRGAMAAYLTLNGYSGQTPTLYGNRSVWRAPFFQSAGA